MGLTTEQMNKLNGVKMSLNLRTQDEAFELMYREYLDNHPEARLIPPQAGQGIH